MATWQMKYVIPFGRSLQGSSVTLPGTIPEEKEKKGAPKTSKLPEKKITVPTSREFLLLKNFPKVAGGDGGEPWLWVQSPTEEILKM